MYSIACDLRYALRTLAKSPGFAMAAILTLALGVGANTAVFSLVNAVLLRPLAFEAPDRLVLVWESAPFFNTRDSPVAPANYFDWRSRSRSFEEMGAIEPHMYKLLGGGEPEVIEGSVATASLFRVLRTKPLLGRIFLDSEDETGAPKVALISEGLWRRRFAADRGIVGKLVSLGGEKHTIVGVLAAGTEPPGHYSPRPGEIWTPLQSAYTPEGLKQRGRHNWMVAARLRQEVTIDQADAEMRAIGASLAREYPDTNEKVGAFVAPLRDHFVDSRRTMLAVLLGTVALVLLIACSNIANLLLCRAADRTKEVAVRTALGAGIWRLTRQFFCESLILCAAGAAIGLWLASFARDFLALLAPGDLTGLNSLGMDWRVLIFTLAITVLTAVVFGLVPLAQVRRLDVSHSLKQTARSLAGGRSSRRVRAVLVCSQVALAFVLLIGAGLLIRSLSLLRGVDTGFRTSNILTLYLPASEGRRTPAKSAAWQQEVVHRIAALPGVVSAGFTNHIPLVVKGDITGVGAEGRDLKIRTQCRSRLAGPGYLGTMGIPVLLGRDIDERDADGAPPVVLVNQTLARALWPGQDPIGRRIHFRDEVYATVVGVTGDIRQAGLDVAPQPEFYASALQVAPPLQALAIHTSVPPAGLAAAVRKTIWSVDPDQPILKMASMEETLDREVLQRSVQTTLLAVFGGLALLLAAIGLYGVLAWLIGQQTPEIGLRLALGAEPSHVLKRVVGDGLKLTFVGLAIGMGAAGLASRLLTGLLYGVAATDPVTWAAVAAVLVITALAASYLPARRAMSIDPIRALREE